MLIRNAKAEWQGDLLHGSGQLSVGSGRLMSRIFGQIAFRGRAVGRQPGRAARRVPCRVLYNGAGRGAFSRWFHAHSSSDGGKRGLRKDR